MRTAALPSPRTRTSGTSAKYDMPLPGDGDFHPFLFRGRRFCRFFPSPAAAAHISHLHTRSRVGVAAMSRMATPRGESEPMASPQV